MGGARFEDRGGAGAVGSEDDIGPERGDGEAADPVAAVVDFEGVVAFLDADRFAGQARPTMIRAPR